VRFERAPFDHPELFVPNGVGKTGKEDLLQIPAVGAAGLATPIGTFLNLDPKQP
jgi:hypothetical protein